MPSRAWETWNASSWLGLAALTLVLSLWAGCRPAEPSIAPAPVGDGPLAKKRAHIELTPDNLRDVIRSTWELPSGHYKRAMRSAIAEQFPDTPEGLFGRGYLAANPFEAVESYRKALELDPTFGEAWMNLENVLFDMGRAFEAREVLEEALQAVGDTPGVRAMLLSRRALRLRVRHEFLDAITTARDAVQSHPSQIGAREQLCAALLAAHRVDECLASYMEALEQQPERARLHVEIAHIYRNDRHDFAKARHHYERAVELSDQDPYYVGQLGYWYRDAAHDYRRAISHFRAAFDAGADPEWLSAIAWTQDRYLGDETAAIETYLRAADLDTLDSGSAARAAASRIEGQGKNERAEEVLREAKRRSPYDAYVRTDLADLLDGHERHAEALEVLEQAKRDIPWESYIDDRIAAVLASNDLDAAIAMMEKVVRDEPQSPWALNRLAGLIARDPTRRDEALKLLERGLRLEPDGYWLNDSLQKLFPPGSSGERRPAMLLDDLYLETGVEEYVVRSANYRRDRLHDLSAAASVLLGADPSPRIENELAGILYAAHDVDGAVERWRLVIEAQPDNLDVHLTLVRRLFHNGNVTAGEAAAEEALARFPDSHRLHDELVDAYLEYDLAAAKKHAAKSGLDSSANLALVDWSLGNFEPAVTQYELAGRQQDTSFDTKASLIALAAERARKPSKEARVVLQMANGAGIVSPDARWSATWSGGIVWVRDLEAGKIVGWFEASGEHLFGFTPDSRSVIVGDDYVWRLYDIRTGKLLGAVPKLGSYPRMSGDCTQVAQSMHRSVVIHDVKTGVLQRQVRIGTNRYGTITAFDWSSDEKLFSLGFRTPTDHAVVVLDAETGAVVHRVAWNEAAFAGFGLNNWAHDVRFAPDSTRLALSVEGRGQSVFMLDLESGDVTAGYYQWSDGLWFSPDGSRVAFAQTSEGPPEIVVADGTDLTQLARFEVESVTDIRFTRDNKQLISGGIYRIEDGKLLDSLESSSIDGRSPQMVDGALELIDWKGRRSLQWDLQRGNAMTGAGLPEDIDHRPRRGGRKTWLWGAGPDTVIYKRADAEELVEVSRETGRELRRLPYLEGRKLWSLDVDPTGKTLIATYVEWVSRREELAWVSFRDNLDVYLDVIDLTTGTRVATEKTLLADHDPHASEQGMALTISRAGVSRVAFSPDGSLFAPVFYWSRRQRPENYTRRLQVRETRTGRVRNKRQLGFDVSEVAFSRDSRRLALGSDSGTVYLYGIERPFDSEYLGFTTVSPPHPIAALAEHEGRWFVGNGREVEVWDIERKKQYKGVSGHMGAVHTVLPLPEQDRLITIAHEEVSVWSLSKQRKLGTLMAFADGGWLSFTPEGWYHSSLTGDQEIYWTKGRELLSFDVFEASLRRPQAVYEKLTRGKLVTPEAGKLRARDALSNARPTVEILGPADGTTVGDGTAALKVRWESTDGSVEKIVVRDRDGIVASADVGTQKSGSTVEVPVSLFEGDNRLQVVAVSEYARSDVARLTLRYDPSAGAPKAKGRLRFVSIGVSDHEDDELDLKWAHRDASKLADALQGGSTKLYLDKAAPEVLVDAAAKRGEILDKVVSVGSTCQEDDTLVVFLAGHGINWKGRLFFVAHESDVDKPLATAIWWEQLNLAIATSACARKLVLLDTCHAGGFGGRARDVVRAVDEHADELARDTGALVLAASRGDQKSFEGDDWKHGAFTKALLEALRDKPSSADKDGNGEVSVSELGRYVGARVRNLTEDRQTPEIRPKDTTRDFPILRYR